MASPFESAREPASLEAAERARSDQAAVVSDVTPPASTTHIQPGLDSVTRESLSRLALLIRKQMEAIETADAVDPAQGEKKDSEKRGRDDKENQAKEAEMRALISSGASELPPPQAMPPDSFPAVVRLERCFERVTRERGSRIYQQQKTKDAVRGILDQLEKPVENLGLENIDELLGEDLIDRRAA